MSSVGEEALVVANGQNGEPLVSPRPGVDSNHVAVNLMREEIDRIDQQIVESLQKRFALSLAIGKAKMASNEEVYVPWREELILSKLKASCADSEKADSVCEVYKAVFEASRKLQRRESLLKREDE
ncbi:hypothetical protein NDN08_002491 [Rhodosorus marinus]|uniref:Chorismate mutase domain-containing protein n=1 Tax=Rhodosorus marinus TaxID=101924 RepID=A0AAV8UTV9_9RHOD|nr:hypothetical protein NDN08_002491 [Rhodosorus marinus]